MDDKTKDALLAIIRKNAQKFVNYPTDNLSREELHKIYADQEWLNKIEAQSQPKRLDVVFDEEANELLLDYMQILNASSKMSAEDNQYYQLVIHNANFIRSKAATLTSDDDIRHFRFIAATLGIRILPYNGSYVYCDPWVSEIYRDLIFIFPN